MWYVRDIENVSTPFNVSIPIQSPKLNPFYSKISLKIKIVILLPAYNGSQTDSCQP